MTIVPCKLNVSQQGPAVVKKANIIQGYANRNIVCRTHGTLSTRCALLRYHVPSGVLHFKKGTAHVGHGLRSQTRCREEHGPGVKTEINRVQRR